MKFANASLAYFGMVDWNGRRAKKSGNPRRNWPAGVRSVMAKKWMVNAGIAVFFALPYSKMTWWTFGFATLAIILMVSLACPGTYQDVLKVRPGKWIWAWPLVFVSFALLTERFIGMVASKAGISRSSPQILDTWILQPFFQALNEEMIVRGIVLSVLVTRCHNRWIASLAIALAFAGAHHLFYLLTQDTAYVATTNVSLFFATLAMNNLVFATRSINLAWAVHAGTNFSLFGGGYLADGGGPFLDAQKFNLVLGHPTAAMSTVGAFAVSLALLRGARVSLLTLRPRPIDGVGR